MLQIQLHVLKLDLTFGVTIHRKGIAQKGFMTVQQKWGHASIQYNLIFEGYNANRNSNRSRLLISYWNYCQRNWKNIVAESNVHNHFLSDCNLNFLKKKMPVTDSIEKTKGKNGSLVKLLETPKSPSSEGMMVWSISHLLYWIV